MDMHEAILALDTTTFRRLVKTLPVEQRDELRRRRRLRTNAAQQASLEGDALERRREQKRRYFHAKGAARRRARHAPEDAVGSPQPRQRGRLRGGKTAAAKPPLVESELAPSEVAAE